MAADLIQKILADPTVAADSVASVDVPQDGFIESIYADSRGLGMDALNDAYRFELSFASSNTLAVNDSRISILEISETQQFLTSGGSSPGKSIALIGIDIPVSAGERIHVHYGVAGGTTQAFLVCYLYHRTRGAAPRRRSARRR